MSMDKNIKILVVEDSKITRKMEIKILKQLGLNNIVEADDGDDAILKLQAESDIGLIISDWNMPNKNGYDLLVWVRSDEKCRDLPFIMATAQSEKRQTAKATEAGVSHFVSKPFSPDELQRVIDDTFSGKKPPKPTKAQTERVPQRTAQGKLQLNVAHIQITDHLILGVLKHLIATEKAKPTHFDLETLCMPGWNPVQKALENGEVDAAFILAPIAMDLFSYGVPIKLVLFAHKNGSISVRNRKNGAQALLKEFFKGKTFYIPHILSIHHMLSNMFLKEIGLNPGMAGNENVDVLFEVVPPIKMPEFLVTNPDAGGFTVAEPLGTKTIAAGKAELLYLSGELWEYHPCCVLVVRDEIVRQHPDAVQELTQLLVQSGQLIAKQPEKAAEIAVDFLDPDKTLGLNVPVLKNVLKEPQGIKTDDLFPVIEDLDRIQRYMVEEMGVGSLIDLDQFVDTRFARVACANVPVSRRHSKVQDVSGTVQNILSRQGKDDVSKARLDKEGKYLIFALCDQDYGFSINAVREIIGMMPIRSIPKTPSFLKGVINLRGNVIPVVDLRVKFKMESTDYDDRTCIIILELAGKNGTVQAGVVVDSVSEVLNIRTEEIEDAPAFGAGVNTDFILAMAKQEENVKILLNTNRLFKEEEILISKDYAVGSRE